MSRKNLDVRTELHNMPDVGRKPCGSVAQTEGKAAHQRTRSTSMGEARHNRLERYEAREAECELMAQVTTDRSKQRHYEQLAAQYSFLAASFREALALHAAALALLTLH